MLPFSCLHTCFFLLLHRHQEPVQLSKPKVNIPVPKIEIVEDYEQNVPPDFTLKDSYYRLIKPTREEIDSGIDYTADLEDEQFVAEQQHLIRTNTNLFCYYNNNNNNNLKKMMSATKQQKDNSTDQSNNIQTTQIHLTIHLFEQMIDILEKATAFETIVRFDQAEKLFYEKIESFPPPSNLGAAAAGDTSSISNSSTCPDLMVERVYNYWVQKRCKLKKPLLRNYWPVTSIHDTNPHMVFRPRDKEKYKLRKKRQNDMDAFRKMQLLRKDFERLRSILDMVVRRERLLAKVVDIRQDILEQHMYDCYNTSGYTRTSKLDFQELESLFHITNNHNLLEHCGGTTSTTSNSFKAAAATTARRKRDAAAMAAGSNEEHSQPSTSSLLYSNSSTTGTSTLPPFTQPLSNRDKIVTSWDNAVPYVPNYVNGKISTILEFNHRGRVGRGGRLCIDRFPVAFGSSNNTDPSSSSSSRRRTHYVGGEGPWYSLPAATSSLIDLMPPKLDVKQARMKIAEICAQWSDEEEDEEELNNNTNSTTHVELVKVSDWINTDEQPWGEEKLVIGPL